MSNANQTDGTTNKDAMLCGLVRDLLELTGNDLGEREMVWLLRRLDEYDIETIRTFKQSDIPTTDVGLVIECDDGTEYQLTIKRSR